MIRLGVGFVFCVRSGVVVHDGFRIWVYFVVVLVGLRFWFGFCSSPGIFWVFVAETGWLL